MKRLTPASETLVLFVQDKCKTNHDEARDLVQAAIASELEAVGASLLRRMARGEARHWHGVSTPDESDALTRGAVESLVRSETGLKE